MRNRMWLGLPLAAGIVGGTAVVFMSGAPAPAGFTLTIRLDGGNAFVFSEDSKRVEIGAVRAPSNEAAGFNKHRMRLILTRGEVGTAKDAFPAKRDQIRRSYWPLEGYEALVCPGGKCPTAAALTTAPARTPSPSANCAPPTAQPQPNQSVDNLYYIPNLLELHPGSKLKADWRNRLESRLVLQEGHLTVKRVVSCFTFEGSGPASNRKQSIADGEGGIVHELKVSEPFVDVVFRRPDTPDMRVRVQPWSGEQAVTLLVGSGQPSARVADNELVPHFTPFYELLEPLTDAVALTRTKEGLPPLSLRYTPVVRTVARFVSPGGECPPARFGGPSAGSTN